MTEPAAPNASAPPPRKSIIGSSLVFGGLTMVSRVLGLARDLVIAAYMGASQTIAADAYNTALSFPNLFRRIFAEGAFAAAFVPAYARTLEEKGEAEADRIAVDAMATLAAVTVALTVAAQLAMPWLMELIAPGFEGEKKALAVLLTQITMPYLPCMTIAALTSGVLNARGRFALSALAPTLLNVGMLLAVLPQKTPEASAIAASVAVLVSGLAQAGLLWWGARKAGARVRFVRPRLTPEIRKLIALSVPGAIAASATQVNVFVSGALSSEVDGARSWLNNADRLYQLPLGLVGVAIGVALLPALSRAVQADDKDGAQATMDEALGFAMALTLPATAALVTIPFFLIDGLFTRGQFTAYDARMTGDLLFHFGWGVPAFVLTRVLAPAFFARQDTKGPMWFALASVVVNLAVAVSLFHLIGVTGLAIGVSAAAWVNVGLMVFTLKRRGLWNPSKDARRRMGMIVLSSILMGVFFWLCDRYRPDMEALLRPEAVPALGPKEIAILAVCFAGLIVYAIMLVLTRAITPREIRAALRRRPAPAGSEGQGGGGLPPGLD